MEEEMLVLVPMFIGMAFYWTGRRKAKQASKVLVKADHPERPLSGGAEAKLESFEDRLRVLERIVTDSGYNVSAQIEALRDARRPDEGSGASLQIQRKERT